MDLLLEHVEHELELLELLLLLDRDRFLDEDDFLWVVPFFKEWGWGFSGFSTFSGFADFSILADFSTFADFSALSTMAAALSRTVLSENFACAS